jgi:heme/copper-type cytochrome/quinol oxidase subunit 2
MSTTTSSINEQESTSLLKNPRKNKECCSDTCVIVTASAVASISLVMIALSAICIRLSVERESSSGSHVTINYNHPLLATGITTLSAGFVSFFSSISVYYYFLYTKHGRHNDASKI